VGGARAHAAWASPEEIAARLFISPVTVQTHVSAILRKLHVTTREAEIELLER
jgi:DNA-binding CsgD family transcriptional regulator